MKYTEERKNEYAAVNAALPSGSYEKIVNKLKKHDWANYQFVYDVLNGRKKRWNDNHSIILKEARSIIKEKQKALK